MPERVSIGGQVDQQAAAKDTSEAELVEYWGGILVEMYQDLIDQLSEDNPQPPDNDWWDAWIAAMTAFMVVYLQNTATASAVFMMELTGIGVPLEELVAGATSFSQSYAFSLVKDITDRTREQLQKAITNYLQTPGQDVSVVTDSISYLFGPVRAEMIAITETSRAFERGLDIYEDGLNALGIATDRIWYTMRDERVCQVCEPNEGKLRDADGWTISGVPAHPRDRCWTEIVIVRRT